MVLKINYHDRYLKFSAEGDNQVITGEGLEELLRFLEIYGAIIKKASVSGESPSFTFKRQIYLFLNLLRYLSDCQIEINGNKMKPRVPLIPTYETKNLL